MNNQQRVIALIKSLSGQANMLTIPRVYIALLKGDTNAALLLNQIVYWSDKTSRTDGWFYKSYPEWDEETGLSQFQINRAAKQLKKFGLIETKLKKANKAPTLHYKLNYGLLTDLIMNILDNEVSSLSSNSTVNNEETSLSLDYQETQQSLTETTNKTTTKTTSAAFPDKLNTPEFENAWGRWINYRKQKHSPLVASTIESQIRKLEKYGPSVAIAMIEQSIENGWQGLFELKNTNGNKHAARPKTSQPTAEEVERMLQEAS